MSESIITIGVNINTLIAIRMIATFYYYFITIILYTQRKKCRHLCKESTKEQTIPKRNMALCLKNTQKNVILKLWANSTEWHRISFIIIPGRSLISLKENSSAIITVARFQDAGTMKNLEENTTFKSLYSKLLKKPKYYMSISSPDLERIMSLLSISPMKTN